MFIFALRGEWAKGACKPGSVPPSRPVYSDGLLPGRGRAVAISLGWRFPATSSDLPRGRARYCGPLAGHPEAPLFGLSPGGVFPAAGSPRRRWALAPPFHPCRQMAAVCFCGTLRRVTPPGDYPAPCPAEPGLSSSARGGGGHPAPLANVSLDYPWEVFKSQGWKRMRLQEGQATSSSPRARCMSPTGRAMRHPWHNPCSTLATAGRHRRRVPSYCWRWAGRIREA